MLSNFLTRCAQISKTYTLPLTIGLFWSIYWIYFFSHVLTHTEKGLFLGHVTAYGDWAMHFTWFSTFLYRTFTPQVHPLLIAALPQYPFAINFLSALLGKIGVDYWVAFLLPAFISTIIALPLILFFYYRLFRSQIAGVLATMFFFLNGGLGIWEWILKRNLNIQLPTSFTIQEGAGYVWGNIVHTQLIPQRSMALGLPVSVCILICFFLLFIQDKKISNPVFSKVIYLFSLFLVTFLPVIHTHSFIAVTVILAHWMLWKVVQKQKISLSLWLWGISGALTSLLVFTKFIGFNHDGAFFSWYPGWYTHTSGQNIFLFWWRNWIFVPYLSALGMYFFWKKQRKAFFLLTPFFTLFIAANTVLFQPNPFDNTKILTFASLGMSLSAANACIILWKKKFIIKIAIVLVVTISLASGFADQILIIKQLSNPFLYYTSEELQLADLVRKTTPLDSVIISNDKHNSWVYNLTGRQILMGYEGWMWSYGFNYNPVKEDIVSFYTTDNISKIAEKYNIQYAVITNEEKTQLSTPNIYQYFSPFIHSSNYEILVKKTP